MKLINRYQINRSRRISVIQCSVQISEVKVQIPLKKAGPSDPAPSYYQIDNEPLNQITLQLFRNKMTLKVGEVSKFNGYDAILDLTKKLTRKFPDIRDLQVATREILISLFPGWLLPAFKVMFAKPFPTFSYRLNAFVTALTCQWLMGPCTVNDVEVDGNKMGVGHGVLVKRCRYLEETGCASVCVNCCKVPTQEFFAMNMGIPLTMTPNYEDFSCQYAFGKTPLPQAEDPAFQTPCFKQCPSGQPTLTCRNVVPLSAEF